jgi:hypothetical protein
MTLTRQSRLGFFAAAPTTVRCGRVGAGSLRSSILLALVALAACAGDDGEPAADDGPACAGAKCDDLDEGTTGDVEDTEGTTGEELPPTLEEICAERRMDAFTEGRDAMQLGALRWSCADVPGTPAEERGQEYCEYFAMVQLPGQTAPDIYGKSLGTDLEDGHTPYGIELTSADVDALEADPDAVVGQCVFTAWNSDMEADCGDDCDAVPTVMGVRADDVATFRMTLDFNSREAAVALVADCMDYIAPAGDFDDPDDPLHDPFLRACELNAEINETPHRKSDNIACTAAARLAECGCSAGPGVDLPNALAPATRLGFPLGGWAGPEALPPGCRFADVEPGSHTLVTCDLTALEVLDHGDELKAYCQQEYADDVVVHVPVPYSRVSCEPPPDETYAFTCTETPWVVDP